ncbi:MAG: DCC1-like thiol-disulfide oxidoreductase family protein [Candidatus Caenarcaniphilales bacterium]|nr:DCC1-like thiol-disulfide oxidoreductase family protein [Candidatus Caenarcaniphilales bacterium]
MNHTQNGVLYTLIYDGQCEICRGLVNALIRPYQPATMAVKSSQEVSLAEEVSDSFLERAKTEIILREEKTQKLFGGVAALAKTLELIQKLPLLRLLLEIKLLEPFTSFGYYLFAYNRYSWIPVPGYKRCAECEIKIPIVWNICFFVLILLVAGAVSFANILIWLNWFELRAEALFNTVNYWSLIAIAMLTLLMGGMIQAFSVLIAMLLYRKAPGVNRVEVVKQHYLSSSLAGICVLMVNGFISLLGMVGLCDSALLLTLISGFLCISLLGSGILIYIRWREINFSGALPASILAIDHLLRLLMVFALLYLAL